MKVKDNPQKLTLAELIELSTENARRYHELGATYANPAYCYELFRRALTERNEVAWCHIYDLYQPQVISWMYQATTFQISKDDVQAFVSIIFGKLWRAIGPDSFAEKLTTLGAVLLYLKNCTKTTMIDHGRTLKRDLILDELSKVENVKPELGHLRPMEEVISRHDVGKEFWNMVTRVVKNEPEMIVLRETFVYGMKARQILDDHRDLFSSVENVYRVKENVMKRLRRDAAILTVGANIRLGL